MVALIRPESHPTQRLAIGVLALCVVMNLVSRGMAETLAVFLLPVTRDMGWNRADFGAIYFVYMASHGISAPFAGAIFDRFGARIVYVTGLLIYAGGFLLASVAQSHWQALVGLGLMVGIGTAGTGMALAAGLLSRWFNARISLVMGLAYAGLSLGLITFAPLAQLLIDDFGWRSAYRVLGIGLLCLVPVQFVLPLARMQAGSPAHQRRHSTSNMFVSVKTLKSAPFWGLFTVFFFTAITIWSVMLQAVAYLVSVGFSSIVAATIYGAVGSMSVVGVIATGWLSDRYGRRLVVTFTYLMTITGIGILWTLDANSQLLHIAAFVAIFGATMGARGPVVSTLVARLFPTNVGAVYGAVTIGLGLGAAVGGWVSGMLFDLTGGYGATFILSIASALISVSQFWLIQPLALGKWPADTDQG